MDTQKRTEQNVFERISSEYYNLTNSEKKTADYVLQKKGSVQLLSITELAEASGVAEATVSRFCRRLGYKGYNAFRLAVAKFDVGHGSNLLSGEVRGDDNFRDMCMKLFAADETAMRQTLERVKDKDYIRAADLLERAGKVICMGQGGSAVIAMEAAHLFSTVSGKFSSVADSHMQIIRAATLDPEDVVLYFSYSGATSDLQDTLSVARGRGAKVILVTHFPNSPAKSLADAVLLCGANESPLQLGSVAAKVAQLFLLDVLFSELCRRDLDAARECRSAIAEALNSKHL